MPEQLPVISNHFLLVTFTIYDFGALNNSYQWKDDPPD